MKTNYKNIPFNIELAKKITSGKMKGEIIARSGKKVRILAFDIHNTTYPIAAVIKANNASDQEVVSIFTNEGKYEKILNTPNDLFIRIPTYYKDYSNFKPCKWQSCLVREIDNECWIVRACAGSNRVGDYLFYDDNGVTCTWKHYLPLSNITRKLIGTNKNYEELIQQLDKE